MLICFVFSLGSPPVNARRVPLLTTHLFVKCETRTQPVVFVLKVEHKSGVMTQPAEGKRDVRATVTQLRADAMTQRQSSRHVGHTRQPISPSVGQT